MIFLENDIQTFDNSQTSNLTFIDTNLSNYQSLIPDTNNSNVVLIDSGRDGIEQITQALEQYDNLDSISIFSHGDVGLIQLGNTYLSNASLDSYQADLAAWGNALSTEGDLLLYGCNVSGSVAGLNFVDRVGEITGADVAASNDLTGNVNLGGDWTLEVATGNIETPTFAITEYGHLLDLKFNFTYDRNVTTAQKTAFEFAGRAWANRLSDDVTVNLHVSMVNNSDLPSNTLGGATPFFHQGTSYSYLKKKLAADRSSRDDYKAVSNLDKGTTFDTKRPSYYNDDGQWDALETVSMTRANAKALNLINGNDRTLDGIIVMNNLKGTGVDWQYNYLSDRVGWKKIDFTTVAIHEIGHTLGFVSLVDGITNSNFTFFDNLRGSSTTLDLYRYTENDLDTRNIRSTDSVFSLGNGSAIAKLSTSSRNLGTDSYADGYQASHWNNLDNAGIMDPLLELNVRRKISNLDLRAMDVIGWNRQAGSSSTSSLWWQARKEAAATGNVNRNAEIGEMLNDWRWARRGSRDRLRQNGNIAQFLSQEGFFSVGAFRESFDFSSVNPVIKNDFITVVDNHSLAPEFPTNNDLDVANSSEVISDINIPHVVVESSEINYEEMVALVTEELSDHELSQLSLDDLAQLIEQQLAEPIVSPLN